MVFPTWGTGLCFFNLQEPQAVVKPITNRDGSHCSEPQMSLPDGSGYLLLLLCRILWENLHFNSPREVLESTCVISGQDLGGIFQA